MRNHPPLPLVDDICFGLDRRTDEQSMILFLRRICTPGLLEALVPRMKDEEIARILDLFSELLHTHLQRQEYHRLFLENVARAPDDKEVSP